MSNIDAIREGRGMLPKNLHWIVVGVLAVSGLAVMYLYGKKEEAKTTETLSTAKQEREERLRREKPDVEQLVKEGAAQAPAPQKPEAQKPAPQKPEAVRVPGLETEPGRRDAILGVPTEPQSEDRYGRGQAQTAPILVLTGEERQAQPEKKESTEERILRALNETRAAAQPPALSAEDRKILEAAAGPARAPSAPAALDGQLENARRNAQWLREQASEAESATRRTIGPDPRVSPYTVIQGTAIPAVTVTPVNSDLPGQIVARTTMDVYDSLRGRYLLIPSGSLVYGVYNNAITVGQERLAVVFQRIVFPDGSGVTLGAMPGTDALGSAGLPGEIDNHFWKIFGSSFLIAAVAAIFEPRQDVTNNVYINGSGAQGAMGQVLTDVSRQILGRNTRIAPTVKVGEGQRFNVMVQRDLALVPYLGRQ